MKLCDHERGILIKSFIFISEESKQNTTSKYINVSMSRDGKDSLLLVRILPLGNIKWADVVFIVYKVYTDCIVLIHTLLIGDI